MSLLQMSLVASVLILCIVVLRALLMYRLPKAAFLVLWEIAALRLLLPFSIPLPVSLSPASLLKADIPAAVAGRAAADLSGTAQMGTAAQTGASPLALLWAAGSLLLFVWFAAVYAANLRKFKISLPCTSPAVQEFLARHPGRRCPEVRISDRITSPLTYGILHPVILLPKSMDLTGKAALDVVLTHECVHIRRLDALAKLLFAAALCLHWWNPLVWVLYLLANRDMELSCDEAVLRALGANHRSAYALTLISMEETRSQAAGIQSYFSKNAITERIEAIMKFKKSSVAAILAAVLLIIAAVFFLTGGASAEQKAADSLEKSIQYQNGVLSFTIPQDYDQPQNWNIMIYGQQEFPDGMSMSAHPLEEVSASHSWQPGMEYRIEVEGQYYTELGMDIFLPEDVEKSIDLLAKAQS